jgi:tetratricopeptide (TPR) repeat protein
LWSETPAARRASLFHAPNENVRGRVERAREAEPSLSAALDSFLALVTAPEDADAATLALACRTVYEWADRRSIVPISLHFAECAAIVEPDNPMWAVEAGWFCARAGRPENMNRAAAWYHRAFVLAVRTQNRRESIRALTRFGALMKDLGDREEARRAYERAAKRARRTGRRRQSAVALHYLFALAAEAGEVAEALTCAGRALALYPLHDARLPYLGHDLAFLLVRSGQYRMALRLLDRASGLFQKPADVLLVVSTLARAAGGAGRSERYEAAERVVVASIAAYEEYAPAALVNVAEGARSLGDWERAGRYALTAHRYATERGDAEPIHAATLLLRDLAERTPGLPQSDAGADAQLATLARRFAARLKRWRPRKAGKQPPP